MLLATEAAVLPHPHLALAMASRDVGRLAELACGIPGGAVYTSAAELQRCLPASLAAGARVLKTQAGKGGAGVWGVALAADGAVEAQEASSSRPAAVAAASVDALWAAGGASLGAALLAAADEEGGYVVDQPRLPAAGDARWTARRGRNAY